MKKADDLFPLRITQQELQKQMANIVYSSSFNFSGFNQRTSRILLILTSSLIILKNELVQSGQQIRAIKLTNNLCYRTEKIAQVIQIYQQPYSWKLIIKIQQEFVTLYSSQNQQMPLWNDYLGHRLHKFGFQDDFKPIRRLGQGANALVYMIKRKSDHRPFAVKSFIKKNYLTDSRIQESIDNQIKLLRILSKGQNQSILSLYDVYQSKKAVYLVTDLFDGVLNDIFNSEEKQIRWDTAQVMRDILRGMKQLHENGIVHRDINPNNIAIKLQQKVIKKTVIIDLGCATFINQESYLFNRCGTIGYIAPEMFHFKQNDTIKDGKCDIFSAGLILHLMLLGFHPFYLGETISELKNNNKHHVINFKDQPYSSLGKIEFDLLIKMLDYNPQTRISAQQALRHDFFRQKTPEKQNQNQTLQIIENSQNIYAVQEAQQIQPSIRKCIKQDQL